MSTVMDTMLETLLFFYKTPPSGQSLSQNVLKTALRLTVDGAYPVFYGLCDMNAKLLHTSESEPYQSAPETASLSRYIQSVSRIKLILITMLRPLLLHQLEPLTPGRQAKPKFD